jgi:hypothetical protein
LLAPGEYFRFELLFFLLEDFFVVAIVLSRASKGSDASLDFKVGLARDSIAQQHGSKRFG